MGLGDFVKGVGHVGQGVLGVAAGKVGDTVVDWATEPLERTGQLESLIGRGVHNVAEASGKIGDFAEDVAIAAGVPKPLAMGVNFAAGGAGEWVGDSAADALKTTGFVTQNIDTLAKGGLQAANFTAHHPGEAAALTGTAVGSGIHYARTHPGKIAEYAKDTAVDSFTDPVNLALMVGTGGTSAVLEAGAGAMAKGAVEGGTESVAKSVAESTAKAVAGDVAESSTKAVADSAAKSGVRQAADTARDVLKATFTGRNAPAEGALDTTLESFPLSRTPTGRLAQFRNGLAEKVVGEEGGFFKERLANKITAGSGKPAYGGPAAEAAWRAKKISGAVQNAAAASNALATGAEIAVDPAGFARRQLIAEADRRGIGHDSGYMAKDSMVTNDSFSGRAEVDEDEEEGQGGAQGGGKKSRQQHFWQGSNSQWAGGIGADYNWRTVDPVRRINTQPFGKRTPAEPDPAFNDENFGYTSTGQGFLKLGDERVGGGFNDSDAGIKTVEPDKDFAPLMPKTMPSSRIQARSYTSQAPGATPAAEAPTIYGVERSGQGTLFPGTVGMENTGTNARDWGDSMPHAAPAVKTSKPETAITPGLPYRGTRLQRRREGKSTTGMNPAFKPDFGGTLGI